MLDFHSHILPGLDDGADDMETALDMARIAVADGIGEMVVTPHYIEGSMENPRESILERMGEFRQVLDKEDIPLKMVPGCEVYLSPRTPELLAKKELMTINDGGKYLLVEFPMQSIPNYAEDVVFEIKLQGVTPIIAHPERNLELAKRPDKVLGLVEKGCLMQLNAGSLTGLYGKAVMAAARLLVKNDLVHLIGSDAHSPGGRSPRIRRSFELIEAKDSNKVIKIAENARDILQGKAIVPELPTRVTGQKNSFIEKIKSLGGLF